MPRGAKERERQHREQQRVEPGDHWRPDDLGVAHDLGDAQRRQRDASHDVGAKARFVEGQQALQHWQTPFRLARFVFVGAHGCPCTSAVTPLASACFALALSASLVNSRVLFGSTSLRRKSLPFPTRNGLAPCRATLMISFVFILSQRSVHGLSKVAMREMRRGMAAIRNKIPLATSPTTTDSP